MANPYVETDQTIKVEMEVSRYRVLDADRMVQVWGHVGDYEVCVYLPAADPRVLKLREGE